MKLLIKNGVEYVPRRTALYEWGKVNGRKMLLDYNQHVCSKYGCKQPATIVLISVGCFDHHYCIKHAEQREKAVHEEADAIRKDEREKGTLTMVMSGTTTIEGINLKERLMLFWSLIRYGKITMRIEQR